MEAATLWLKAFHIASLSVWAGMLFYLPGMLAAHARPLDADQFRRLRVMSRLVFLGIASPGAILAIISGSLLVLAADAHGGWLALKITAVALLAVFHIYCGRILSELRDRPMSYRRGFLLSLIAVPAVLVVVILFLVLDQPL